MRIILCIRQCEPQEVSHHDILDIHAIAIRPIYP